MRANPTFQGLDKGFWAHVRSLSQALGYTERKTRGIKVPTLSDIVKGMRKMGLDSDHLVQNKQPTEYAQKLLGYFEYRADVLNNFVQHQLMDAAAAKAMYERLLAMQNYNLPATMNKQKGAAAKTECNT